MTAKGGYSLPSIECTDVVDEIQKYHSEASRRMLACVAVQATATYQSYAGVRSSGLILAHLKEDEQSRKSWGELFPLERILAQPDRMRGVKLFFAKQFWTPPPPHKIVRSDRYAPASVVSQRVEHFYFSSWQCQFPCQCVSCLCREKWKMEREPSLLVVSVSPAKSLQSAAAVKMRRWQTKRPFFVQ